MTHEGAENEDPRIDHIKFITLKALNIDAGTWDNLMWKEDNQIIVKDFLDTAATKLLLFYFDRNEKLTLATEFLQRPPMPKLIVYFLKYKNIVVSMTDFKKEMMCGNLTNMPLRQYQALYEQVIAPILCNSMNNKRWPDEIAKDIDLHFKDFQKVLSNCVGLAQGNTVLPIPEAAKGIANIDIDSLTSDSIAELSVRTVLDSVGEMVVEWTHLVNEVLELTSEHILEKDKDQGPSSEISFWKDRKNNLEFIYSQVSDPLVKKIIIALEKTNNCYLPALRKVLQDIAEGLDEAEDICNSLESMSDELKRLETCNFDDLIYILPETMKSITSSWMQSKYFSSTPSRVSILVKKMCNLLIQRMKDFVNPKDLLADTTINLIEVKLYISRELKDVFMVFIKSYNECRNTMENTFQTAKPYPWEFPDQRVFNRLENFIQRLDDLQEIFEAGFVYFSIPDHKITSIQLASLKKKLDTIYKEFCDNYKLFRNMTYNPFDLESEAFTKDCETFHVKLRDLDCRLGAAISQGCTMCHPSEDAFQLMQDLKDLLQRPLVNMEFKSCISSLIANVNAELLVAKEMHENQVKLLTETGKCLTHKNLPPVAGALQWSTDLKVRLSSLVSSLKNIEQYYVTSEDAHIVLELHSEMEGLLNKFEEDIFNKWSQSLSEKLPTKIEQSIFIKDEKLEVILNFDFEILEAALEIKHMKHINKEGLPAEAEKFHETSETMLTSWSLLSSTVRWYKYLIENVVEFEKKLISQQWDEIGSLFQEGMNKKWSSSDLLEYAENIYNITKAVYESVNQTKKNIREIVEFITTWNTEPMYVRETPTSLVDFQIYMTPRVKRHILAVKETSTKMKEKLEENLSLFKCDPESEAWKNYVFYLEDIILNGLKEGIKCSLQYLIDNTNAEDKQLAPFYKIFMMLEEDVTYLPPLWSHSSGSLIKLFEAVVKQIYSLSTEITRMTDPSQDYHIEVRECYKLSEVKSRLLENIRKGALSTVNKTEAFKPYCDLWLQDINDILDDFVLYGPIPDHRAEEESDEEISDEPVVFKAPTEEEFREQIAQFDVLYRKVDDIKPLTHVESWLVLDTSIFKDRLLAIIRKWISAYKHKLIEQKSLGKLSKVDKDEGD